MSKTIILSLALALPLTACTGEDPGTPGEPTTTTPRSVGVEQDLGSVIDEARLAFRATADGFHAGFSTHEADVRDGALQFTPRHWNGTDVQIGAPIQFATTSIARGDELISAAPAGAELRDGDVSIARGAATEVLDHREDGVEQRWRFERAPQGSGDLEVTVAVSGFETVTAKRSGLHFMNPGRLGVRYSHAIWVDADGKSWDVPATWDGEQIVIRVAGDVVDASAYPAVLDPVLTAQVNVDTAVAGFTGARASEPVLAWSGDRFLAVWRDDRLGAGSDIICARLLADGTIVDKRGLFLDTADFVQNDPVVTWTGNRWIVAWTDDAGDIFASVVTIAGAITPLGAVAQTAAIESQPAIASNGNNGALLVWQADGDVRGALYAGGAFGAAFDIAVAAGVPEDNPTVAGATGGDYLVAWEQNATASDIYGQLVTGNTLNGAAFAISIGAGNQQTPAATFAGGNFVLTWRHAADIWGTRVTTTGTVTDVTGTVGGVVISSTPASQVAPAVACDSASCLFSWQEKRTPTDDGLFGQRRGLDFTVQGTEVTLVDEIRDQRRPGLTGLGTGFAAVWEDARQGPQTSALFARLDASGGSLDGTGKVLNTAAINGQNTPAYARNATTHITVWSDARAYGEDLRARLFNFKGTPIGTDSFVVNSQPFDQFSPSVDFDGTQFMVVWADARNPTFDIFGARVRPDGTIDDPAGFPIGTAANHQLRPDIASGGGVSLVAWQDSSNGTDYDLHGAILTTAGTVMVPDFAICASGADQERPAVAWDPVNGVFVVAWQDGPADAADIWAARVAPDGTVVDPCGWAVTLATNTQLRPQLAFSGTQLLVTWDDRQTDEFGDVYGAFVSAAPGPSLTVGTPFPIATGASAQTQPSVVGTTLGRFGVAWTDDINDALNGTDIMGSTVLSDGTFQEANYPIANTVNDEFAPAFQAGVNTITRADLAYQRRKQDVARAVRRGIGYTEPAP